MRTIPFGKPILGDEEKQAVMDVMNGTMLVHGPRSKEFEASFARFTGCSYATSIASCTAGLHLAYFDMGLGKGDEVIVPAQTHTATAHAVEYCEATCVFVDADATTGNIDIDGVEAAVTPNTRAISVVHFLGKPVDMDRINAIAKKHDLFVLEDCALSIGASYKGTHTGLIGDAGSFSFYPVKHMTTAEGGMFVSRHEDILKRITKKKAFGVDRVVGERKVPGVYDVTMLGYNYRMNELEAAIGIEQLKRVPGFLQKRAANYSTLASGLAEIEELTIIDSESDENSTASHYCLSVILKPTLRPNRADIMSTLKETGVGTSVYYPRPVPHMTYYKEKYGCRDAEFPNAAAISYGSIALPVGPHLDAEDMAHIVQSMKQALTGV